MERLTTSQRTLQKIGLGSGPLAFLVIMLLPTLADLEPAGQRMLAVAAWMALWWLTEAIPIAVTALLPLVLYPVLQIATSKSTASTYGDHLIFLFLGGFFIAIAIEHVNLHRRIALNIIRIMGTSPSRLILGFMIGTAFLSMWISNTASTMMMLPIAMALTKRLTEDLEPYPARRVTDTFGLILMLGIAWSASIGGVGTLIGTPPNLVFAGFVKKLFPNAPEITFARWLEFGLPLVVIFLPLAWLYLTRIVPKIPLRVLFQDIRTGPEVIREERERLGRVTAAERRTLAIFLLAALSWIFRSPIHIGVLTIPGLTMLVPGITDATVAMFYGILLFLIPRGGKREGKLLPWKKAVSDVPWGIILLFGGGFALAFGMENTGLTTWIGSHIKGLTSLPLWATALIIGFTLMFVTEVTSNTATVTMLLPVVAATAIALGQNPLFFMVIATVSASFAFMFPVATPPNAIVFASGWVRIPQMARFGFYLNVFGVVLVTGMMYLIGLGIFGIDLNALPSWAVP